ncbi:hypothetical protein EYZ11_013446 [Aspergillus tanneri]|uniref:Uncharacterized protein n=1 Tax=Aspergillus tanneri TaxID=1220188 RepID=A0A4S3IXM9_9EURO|nr:hypothetical protein EYZ11_013446 [Aspergillus tanneri]
MSEDTSEIGLHLSLTAPLFYREAITSLEADKWIKAMLEKIDMLKYK